jgi:hypothetical protein
MARERPMSNENDCFKNNKTHAAHFIMLILMHVYGNVWRCASHSDYGIRREFTSMVKIEREIRRQHGALRKLATGDCILRLSTIVNRREFDKHLTHASVFMRVN